jgi:hypothetical protein
MYNNGNYSRWTSPMPGAGELPERWCYSSYNRVELEIPLHTAYNEDWKTQFSANRRTRSFVTRANFERNSLRVYINGNLISSYDVDSVNSFVIRTNMIGQDGYLWVSYDFKMTELDRIYGAIEVPGLVIQKMGISFDTEYIRELCTVINKIESFLLLPETLWVGGRYNNKFGAFDLISGITSISIAHFEQIGIAINNLLEEITRRVGQLNLNELIIVDEDYPSQNGKIFSSFLEKCRTSLTKIEEVLLSL